MLDIKAMKSALEQLEAERGISKEKIFEAIEAALAAAYKKDFGKKDQMIRAKLDMNTGAVEFEQIKKVVDETRVRFVEDDEELAPVEEPKEGELVDERVRFNTERHILLDDAKLLKKNVELDEEISFPLDAQDDFGRIAAQTAKQVVIQKIREAERSSVLDEFGKRGKEIVTGIVQRIERGTVFVDLGRAIGIIGHDDQVPGERFRQGERVRSYLYLVEESPSGVMLRLSRSHPEFVRALFAMEAPEVASGIVELKSIAREAGSRTKIAVASNDPHVDPVGSCVGQRGVRVATVISELGGEKIDVVEWEADPAKFIADALSPAKVKKVDINEEERRATVDVLPEQLSLAIGRGGQNARLAVKLTGYRIDIRSSEPAPVEESEDPEAEVAEFIASESTGMPNGETVTEAEEIAVDKSVVAENTNSETE